MEIRRRWKMEYLPTKYASVEDKEKFTKHFKRFVQEGCPEKLFSKWFYERLSMCFGHIAHYDWGGFYYEQFSTPERVQRWKERIVYWKAYGDPRFTWSDVEKHLSAWMADYLGMEIRPDERRIYIG
jgi:hypothetical protein